MSQDEKKDQFKAKIVAFVKQCTTDGVNPISFNEFSKNNPDRKQLDSKEALSIAVTLVKENKLKLVQDEDNISEFMVHKFEQAVDQGNTNMFIDDYSRFLARADILGASFVVENGTYLGSINLPQVDKISGFVDTLDFEKRTEFLNQFNTYISFEKIRIAELVEYTNTINGSMEQENQKQGLHLPSCWKERAKYICRYLVVLFSHQFLFELDLDGVLTNFPEFMQFLFELIAPQKEILLPVNHFSSLVEKLSNSIAILVIGLTEEQDTKPQLEFAIKSLDYLDKVNRLTNPPKIPFKEFINETVSDNLNMNYIAKQYYQRQKKLQQAVGSDFVYLDYPWMFSTAAKVEVLQSEAKLVQNEEVVNNIFGSFGLMGMIEGIHLNLDIRRDHILDDALTQLSSKSKSLRKPLKVKFIGEQGVDAGGVRKEFFHLLIEELFNPNYAMFLPKNNRFMWFNKSSFECNLNFELIGVMLALAIYNSVLLDLKFPRIIYKKLLGQNAVLQDLQEFEPDLFNTLRNIKNMETGFEDLDMTLSISYDNFGAEEIYELVEGGSDIALTRENRDEFVEKYLQWYFNTSIEKQYNPFHTGFYKVISKESIRVSKISDVFLSNQLFTVDEIIDLICGKEELDFKELERSTLYEGFDKNHQVVKWFWEVLHSFDGEQKKKFLLFSTGSDRSPLRGLKDLRFTLSKQAADDLRIPSTHTCFNHFLLPEYSSKEILTEKLLQAMENCQGFGLIQSSLK